LAAIRSSYFRQSLNEYFALTRWIPTTKAAGFETDSHRESLPWKILQITDVMAMARTGDPATAGTLGILARANVERESTFVTLDAFKSQGLRVGKYRLRMARGSCHRFPSLKHFRALLFGSF
jgi:hypothetical protein